MNVGEFIAEQARLSDQEFLESFRQPVLLPVGGVDADDELTRELFVLPDAPRLTLTLGRRADCDLQLSHASISGQHAQLQSTGDGWTIADLGSTNGTVVDNETLEPGQPRPLASGALIQLGLLTVYFLEPADFLPVLRRLQLQADSQRWRSEGKQHTGPGGGSARPTTAALDAPAARAGDLAETPLVDLLREICTRQLTGRLTLGQQGAAIGWISFRLGEPWRAATADGLRELAAIRSLVKLERSSYRLDEKAVAGERAIHASFPEILLTLVERRSKKQLAAGEERHQALLDAVLDGILTCDAEGFLLSANAAAERLFAASEAELLGRPFGDLLAPAARPRFQRRLEQGRLSGALEEYAGQRLDGSELPLEIAFSQVEQDDQTWITAVARDISPRLKAAQALKRAEDALQQTRRLEALGQLASGVAHDFNNLLTVIRGNLSLIESALPNAAPALGQLASAEAACQQAANLVQNLLTYAEQEEPVATTVDPNRVIGRMTELWKSLLGTGYELRPLLQQNLGRVRLDPGLLERILTNLVTNARDALPHGGTITLATRDVDLRQAQLANPAAQPGRFVEITVSDPGTGMSAEVLRRACEPFFTTKPRGQGCGLGLATAQGALTREGGQLTLSSEVGAGTEVRLHIPWASDQSREPTPPPGEHRLGGRILVVEDDGSVLEFVRDALAGLGYAVMAAGSAEEALWLGRDSSLDVDLLLTDVTMPGMNGVELAERWSAGRPQCPVLFMSGHHDAVLPEGSAFLPKPFDLDELESALGMVLG